MTVNTTVVGSIPNRVNEFLFINILIRSGTKVKRTIEFHHLINKIRQKLETEYFNTRPPSAYPTASDTDFSFEKKNNINNKIIELNHRK